MLTHLHARTKKPSKSSLHHVNKFTITPMHRNKFTVTLMPDVNKHKVLLLDAETHPLLKPTRSGEQPIDQYHQLSLPDLPDVFLLGVFANLSIPDQLRLGSTCTRMRLLQERAFQSLTCLTLLIGDDPLKVVWWSEYKLSHLPCDVAEFFSRFIYSHLSLSYLHFDTVKWITLMFTCITELSIIIRGVSWTDVHQAAFLLSQLSPSLTTLKLYICISPAAALADYDPHTDCVEGKIINSENLNSLLLPVNYGLPRLKHLALFVQDYLKFESTGKIHLPILSQLEEFNFCSLDEPACLADSLRRYALTNKQLVTRICCMTEGDISLRIDSAVTSYFTSLDISSSSVPQILAHFGSLTNVSFDCNLPPYGVLLEALAQLKQLTSLLLVATASDMLNTSTNLQTLLPVLPSVKVFHTKIYADVHVNLSHVFQLKQCFPNLQWIRVWFQCDSCEKCGYSSKPTLQEKKQCAKRWTRSLRKLKIKLSLFEFTFDDSHEDYTYEQLKDL